MEILSKEGGHSVVVLDNETEPLLALPSKTLFDLINLLDTCRGFVAGVAAKENAVALAALVDQLNSIATEYASVAAEHGYKLEVSSSYERIDFAAARKELDDIIKKLRKLDE